MGPIPRLSRVDALSSLAFYLPSRAPFFTSELEPFCSDRDQELDPLTLKGSTRGHGMPQSSDQLRRYAVDFDADGRPDIWRSVPDVLASVAITSRSRLGGRATGWR